MDAEHQLVVATDLTANASDQGELPVLLDTVKETFDAQPATVLADAGYCNERDLTDLEKRGVDVCGAGPGGQAGGYPQSGGTSGDGSDDREAGDAGGPGGVCAAQVVVGGSLPVLGFRRFSLRGLAKVRGEWDLVCLALNVKL